MKDFLYGYVHTWCAWMQNQEDMAVIIVIAELGGLLERTNAGLLYLLLSGKTGNFHQSTRNTSFTNNPKGEYAMSALT